MAKNHYINNKDFLTEMIKYRQDIHKAKKEGKAKPKIPNYVGECFMKIAENLSDRDAGLPGMSGGLRVRAPDRALPTGVPHHGVLRRGSVGEH